MVAGDAAAFYLGKLAAPVALGFDYGRTPYIVLHAHWHAVTWLAPAALIAAAWWLRRCLPEVALGVAIAAVALFPVLGFKPFEFQYYSTVADRYMYLAMLGPAIVLAALWMRLRSRQARVAVAVILSALACASFVQTGVWRDSDALFKHELAVRPQSWLALDALAYYDQINGKFAESVAPAREGVRLNPWYHKGYEVLITAYRRTGQDGNALEAARAGMRMFPTDGAFAADAAQILLDHNVDSDELIHALSVALMAKPTAALYVALGLAYHSRGDLADAVAALDRAAALDPRDTVASEDRDAVRGELAAAERGNGGGSGRR